eukprot:Skav213675  [mRNA]  locus=scaffold491:246869:247953:+ [translate_table: standard]
MSGQGIARFTRECGKARVRSIMMLGYPHSPGLPQGHLGNRSDRTPWSASAEKAEEFVPGFPPHMLGT